MWMPAQFIELKWNVIIDKVDLIINKGWYLYMKKYIFYYSLMGKISEWQNYKKEHLFKYKGRTFKGG